MTAYPFDRRAVLAGLAALAVAPALAQAAVTPVQVDVPVGARTSKVTIWSSAAPRAAVLFSVGGNSAPGAYDRIAQFLVGQGYAVLAALPTDSTLIPEAQRASLQTSFPDRIADMAALAAYARGKYAGLPLVAMGHSYGSLFALIAGGGLSSVAQLYAPDIKAVVCFSSPGAIPNLINPTSYTTLKVPLLMITGDRDTVPGFVTDWHDHLLPFNDTTMKDSYALIIKGGAHTLVAQDSAGFNVASSVLRDFLSKELFGTPAVFNLPSGAQAELKSK